MNLRMDDSGFRFRITPEDLNRLLAGREIEHRLCVGGHCFGYRISPLSRRDDMHLEMAVGGFCLHVPKTVLEELGDMGISKGGISVTQDGVDVSLQVDMKAQMREAA